MSEQEVEDMELLFEDLMLSSTVEILRDFAKGVSLPEEKWQDKKKTHLMKNLRKFVEDTDDSDRFKILQHATTTLNILSGRPVSPAVKVEESSAVHSKGEVGEMKLNLLRKDFIVIGKVGDPSSDKDVGYLGIVRQMEEGKEKGYTENEIVAAVLKAIVPRTLRTWLGMEKDLKIPRLSQILRNFYNEKSATELYQELITMKQEKSEDPTAFVIRALETREKIIFASQEADAVKYEKAQVQKLFVATIESGIDAEVATKIRSFLLQRSLDDVELLNQVNQAQASMKMRLQKVAGMQDGKKQRCAGVSGVSTGDDTELMKTLKEMKASLDSMGNLKKQVDDLKNEVQELKKNKSSAGCGTNYRPLPKCQNCKDQSVEHCSHCFKCGSSEHFSRGCKKHQENRRGLPQRGSR